jgi:hypothetical protein
MAADADAARVNHGFSRGGGHPGKYVYADRRGVDSALRAGAPNGKIAELRSTVPERRNAAR